MDGLKLRLWQSCRKAWKLLSIRPWMIFSKGGNNEGTKPRWAPSLFVIFRKNAWPLTATKTVSRNKNLTSWERGPRQKTKGKSAFENPENHPPCSACHLTFPLTLADRSIVRLLEQEGRPASRGPHLHHQKACPVVWSINRTSRSQSNAVAISCKSFMVKLLRLNLLCMFCGLVPILFASSVSVIFPRLTKSILMYSVISMCITSPILYTIQFN